MSHEKLKRMFIEIQSDQCLVDRKNSLGPWTFGRNFRNVITATVTRSSLDFLFMKKMHKVRHHVINFWKSRILKKIWYFYPYLGVVFTEDEKNFSLRMMKNWVEFIKTGNISGWEDFRKTEPGFLVNLNPWQIVLHKSDREICNKFWVMSGLSAKAFFGHSFYVSTPRRLLFCMLIGIVIIRNISKN